jgi:hypothetical protein
MKSQHFGVPRECPWPTKGAIYKPHLEREPLPLGASFCDGTGYGGAPSQQSNSNRLVVGGTGQGGGDHPTKPAESTFWKNMAVHRLRGGSARGGARPDFSTLC